MKNFFWIILTLVPVSVFAQQKLTLEEALQLGMQNSKAVQIAESRVIAATSRIREISSQGLPQVGLSAGYTRFSDVPPFDVEVPQLPEPVTISDQILNSYGVQVSVQQAIFTGLELGALKKSAMIQQQAAEQELEKARNEIALDIHKAFWAFHRAQETEKLVQKYLKQVDRHLSDTRKFFEQDLVIKNDVLKLEVQKAKVRLLQIESENSVRAARLELNRSVGIPLQNNTGILAPIITPEPLTPDVDGLVAEALTNRLDISILGLRIDGGEALVTASKSGYLPHIYATANVYYAQPNPRIQPPLERFDDTWDAGISLSWKLWDWGNTRSKAVQSKQEVIQARAALRQLEEAVEMEVRMSYLGIQKAIAQISVTRKAVEQAQESYRLTEKLYDAQAATSSELTDVEVSLNEANTNLVEALVEYRIADAQLKQAVGRSLY